MKKTKTKCNGFNSAQSLQLAVLSVSILLLVKGIMPHPAYGDIRGAVSGSEYKYKVTNLPDFDQVRKPLKYGTFKLVGLPGNGTMYCVPTATLNLLAYIASHGFPEVTPGFGFWDVYSTANYNKIGTALIDLGKRMYTGASDGTQKGFWYASLLGTPYIPLYPYSGLVPYNKFTVSAYFKKDSYVPRISTITKSAIFSNGLVALIHGWYKSTGGLPDLPSYVRDGGHCLTLQQVSGNLGNPFKVYLRDPGSEVVAAPHTQSTFASNKYIAEGVDVCLGYGLMCSSYEMTALYTDPPDNANRFLDGAILIATKGAYTFSDNLNLLLLIKANQLKGTNPPDVQSYSIRQDAASIKDIVMTPDMDGFTYIADNQVFTYDPLTANVVSVTPDGFFSPSKLAYSRQRYLYVLDGDEVVQIDTDREVPQEISRITPTSPSDLIAFNDAADEVFLLSTTNRTFVRYPWHLDGRPEPVVIPEEISFAGRVALAVNPSDASIWIMSSEAGALYRLTQTGAEFMVETFTHPELQNPQSFDLDDAGNIFVSMNGMISEFSVNESRQLELVQDSPFAGQPAGSILKMTHSRTNYDEALHGGPEWRDVFPESAAPGIPDCPADIAPEGGDGLINREDLRLVIRHWWRGWGDPADINDDGIVNRKDLFAVIEGWGRCSR
jgi:hypothetical protein